MENKKINTVTELIEKLKKYPGETPISHLTGGKEAGKSISDLFLLETNPIGDRDTEDLLMLTFANTPDALDYPGD